MSYANEVEVRSIDDLLLTVAGKEWSKAWYRGVTSRDYSLEPSIYRKGLSKEQESIICDRFDKRSIHVLNRRKNDKINLLILMQQFRLPTRLLDWTSSLPIALSFALGKYREGTPTVWALNPIVFGINGRADLPTSHDYTVETYAQIAFNDKIIGSTADMALAFVPHYPDARMNVQQSRFTIHGLKTDPLEKQIYMSELGSQDYLLKIVLNVTDKDRAYLKRIRLDDGILYPDREGLIARIEQELETELKLKPGDLTT